MARYRTKDDIDLGWNRIRRGITRGVDTEIMDFREAILNRLLGVAWEEYQEAISTGKRLELDSKGEAAFVRRVLEDTITVKLERADAPS